MYSAKIHIKEVTSDATGTQSSPVKPKTAKTLP